MSCITIDALKTEWREGGGEKKKRRRRGARERKHTETERQATEKETPSGTPPHCLVKLFWPLLPLGTSCAHGPSTVGHFLMGMVLDQGQERKHRGEPL
jgi:hypothetical protein